MTEAGNAQLVAPQVPVDHGSGADGVVHFLERTEEKGVGKRGCTASDDLQLFASQVGGEPDQLIVDPLADLAPIIGCAVMQVAIVVVEPAQGVTS